MQNQEEDKLNMVSVDEQINKNKTPQETQTGIDNFIEIDNIKNLN